MVDERLASRDRLHAALVRRPGCRVTPPQRDPLDGSWSATTQDASVRGSGKVRPSLRGPGESEAEAVMRLAKLLAAPSGPDGRYQAMQAAIDHAYSVAGRQSGARVAPAGEAWQRVLAADPSIPLWVDDGSHPAPAGTYLAACVLYATVFGASPVGLDDHEGLSDSVATELQRAAAGA